MTSTSWFALFVRTERKRKEVKSGSIRADALDTCNEGEESMSAVVGLACNN